MKLLVSHKDKDLEILEFSLIPGEVLLAGAIDLRHTGDPWGLWWTAQGCQSESPDTGRSTPVELQHEIFTETETYLHHSRECQQSICLE